MIEFSELVVGDKVVYVSFEGNYRQPVEGVVTSLSDNKVTFDVDGDEVIINIENSFPVYYNSINDFWKDYNYFNFNEYYAESEEGVVKETLTDMAMAAYAIAYSKGWHDEPRTFGDGSMLIVTEVAEMVDAFRKHNPPSTKIDTSHVAEEAADILIRLLDFCVENDIPLADAYCKKMRFNNTRSFKHGGKLI